MTTCLKIWFAAAEVAPFAKVGGLADVAAALPKALARRGHDVTVLVPGYATVGPGAVVGSVRVEGEYLEARQRPLNGISLVSLTNDRAFGREEIYGYDDDEERFGLFARGVAALARSDGRPPDVLHLNDWHAAPAAEEFVPSVLTIHNLAYGRPVLARGIAAAEAITTVSERYLEEILTPEGGMGLDILLRSRRDSLAGILNGVDYDEFDPARDPHLVCRYDAASLEGKRWNAAALRETCGLASADAPLAGMVSRLVGQKGLDLVCACLDDLAALGVQLVVVGDGDARYRRCLEAAAARRPGSIAFPDRTDERLARLVYAGCDLLLAPSTYEPCGLGPLIALRYGTIPVVRRTGGLAETVSGGLGFSFARPRPEAFLAAVRQALDVFRDVARWRALQRRAMATDFSWDRAAAEYERLYLSLVRPAALVEGGAR